MGCDETAWKLPDGIALQRRRETRMHARLQTTVAPVVPQGSVRTPGRLAQSFRGPIATARPISVPSTHQRGLPEAYALLFRSVSFVAIVFIPVLPPPRRPPVITMSM